MTPSRYPSSKIVRAVLVASAVLTVTSEFLTVFKNSSLALTIGLLELTARSNMIMDWTFQGFEAYTAATVIYVSVTMVVTLIMQRIENKTQIPGFISKKT